MTQSNDWPTRLLMGPGPSNVSAEVLAAQAMPTIGHLDPVFGAVMEEVKAQLRAAFCTENAMTFPISAPASLAMEAALVNILAPGDKAVIGINGVFGGRMADIAERAGAEVTRIEAPWGTPLPSSEMVAAIVPGTRLVGFVHAETSTGVETDPALICAAAQKQGAISVVDTVTGLGGIPVEVDRWGADIVYSGSQKCLSVPPGIAPITFSEQALDVIRSRESKVQSWFCDLNLVLGYWSGEGARSYHHTAPVNAVLGLREGLRRLLDEGLEASHARHKAAHQALVAMCGRLGLTLTVAEEHRLPQLNLIDIPEGVDEALVRRRLLDEHGIEIGAGLGPLAGKVWRIGLMGETARTENVDRLEAALKAVL